MPRPAPLDPVITFVPGKGEWNPLKTRLDARGTLASFAYDALDRVAQVTYPDETVSYSYDCAGNPGRLCSIADAASTTTYAYDAHGRVSSKAQTIGTLTQTVGYAYNAAGQLASITMPSGHVLSYTYVNNRPTSISVDGQLVLDSVFYEPFGPNGGWRWGNSTGAAPNFHTRLFDKDFRAGSVTSDLPAAGAAAHAFDHQFTWDAASRITSIADIADSTLNAAYGYDALDRVTSAAQGANSWGYTFDGDGNRKTSTVNSAQTTYSYFTGSNRLQSLTGARTRSYSYDAAGNMTSDGLSTWSYGGDGRASQVVVSGLTVQFDINALGQRVRKSSAAGTTRFVYDEAGHLIGEYGDDGTPIEETAWLGELPVAILKPDATGLYYVHSDHLGTPRMVTRPVDNAIVWRWDNTEAFGNSQPNQDPSGLGTFAYNVRFPGQYADSETGKYYNYFRDYDPSIGRYVESDPMGLRAGLNTYAYVGGQPLSLMDQFGLQIAPPGGGAGAAGAAGSGSAGAAGGVGSGSNAGVDAIVRGFSRLITGCMPKTPCTLFKAEFKKDVKDFDIFPNKPTIRFGGRVWCHYRCPSGDTKVLSYYVGPSQIFNDADAWGFCPKTEEE